MKKKYFIMLLLGVLSFQLGFSQEICNNGLDDDADGYVDEHDPDCYTATIPSCLSPAPAPDFSIQLAMQGPANTLDVSMSPTIGDLDGDGISEIIAPLSNCATGYTSYHVVGGTIVNTGINFPINVHQPVSGTVVQPAIADVDKDGTAEVIAVHNNGYVVVFDHLGAVEYVSDLSSGFNYGSPRVADIDEDGIPEIIVGLSVFKFDFGAGTLNRVAIKNAAFPHGKDGAAGSGYWGADIVVVDILPTNPGKEIVAGSIVYGVNFVTGTLDILKDLYNINAGFGRWTDGPTAVADLDLDGDLDVVFDTGTFVVAWDPVEDAQLMVLSSTGGTARSMPTIAYVYDEVANNGMAADYPEVLIGNQNVIRAFNVQMPSWLVWSFATTDSSGETGITTFDFNGDGIQEMIYNDETQIRIIDGNTTTPSNLATFASGTATWMEHPVVADVDNDNQAEMIAFTGGTLAFSGSIKIFKAGVGTVWQPARKIWNQRGYRVVNIKDDLTIPTEETDVSGFMPITSTTSRVLNQFNSQFNPNNLILEPGIVAATDAQIDSATYNLVTN